MTQTQIATYQAALKEARSAFDQATKRLTEITNEADYLNNEISRLRRTITALAAMCSESPRLDFLGITDSCMEVMEQQKRTVSTAEVVSELENLGFDLASQKNAAASVHVVLTRLAAKGKVNKIEEDEKIFWRGPNYDKDYDEIPF